MRGDHVIARPLARLGASLRRGTLALGILAASGTMAVAGHEVTFYPSYYPHAIRIDTVPPEAAAAQLADNTLHAYLGALPAAGQSVPEHVKSVESLGSFVVLGFNPASSTFASADSRCAAAQGILAALRTGPADFVPHPYPVTPYHPDYLHHLDRIAAAEAAVEAEDPFAGTLKVRAQGGRLEEFAGARWELASSDWDVSLEEIEAFEIMADLAGQINGGLGPPWGKEGWFQAYRLLAPGISDAPSQRAAESIHRRLVQGDYLNLAEQADLERRLIATLTGGCERLVVGYTVRRQPYSAQVTSGIENVGYDSQTGLSSPVFVRTVKLKDYPWNGEVRVGVAREPEAAWNPVAGFTDPAGRLVWSTVGDPALLPIPYNASWVPNRLDFTLDRVRGQSGGFKVPADALRPEPGTGLLQPVPVPSFASAKLVYEVVASPFLDGTETGVADLLYTFMDTYRWGARAGPDDRAYDPHVSSVLATIRDRLVGVRALRVDRAIKEVIPGVEVAQNTPVLEVYLEDTAGDPQQVAALAAPWSTVPWHLMVLMEEAVLRGHAAFSKAEAERRGVPWLDLVRDAALHERLLALIEEFATVGYRPVALQDLVSEDDARARWRALRRFAEQSGHLLVTNGPYRLETWTPRSAVFQAVRELTYPLGFGTFDRFVHPLRALVREVTREAGQVTVRVEVERTVKSGRGLKVELVPLDRHTARGTYGALVVSRYLLIGPDGRVVRADKMDWQEDDRFLVDLPEEMGPGRYTILVAVYLDGNSLRPSTGMLRFEAAG